MVQYVYRDRLYKVSVGNVMGDVKFGEREKFKSFKPAMRRVSIGEGFSHRLSPKLEINPVSVLYHKPCGID